MAIESTVLGEFRLSSSPHALPPLCFPSCFFILPPRSLLLLLLLFSSSLLLLLLSSSLFLPLFSLFLSFSLSVRLSLSFPLSLIFSCGFELHICGHVCLCLGAAFACWIDTWALESKIEWNYVICKPRHPNALCYLLYFQVNMWKYVRNVVDVHTIWRSDRAV